MRTRPFGRLGWPVTEIGHGLWGVGGWADSDDDRSLAAIEESIARGCTFFDTALAYGQGKSERLLGQALSRHPGARVTIATKIPPKNQKWPASATDVINDVFPPDHIRRSTETSLENLGVPHVDLQQFHVWTDEWAADDGWQRAVDDLRREGLIGGIGISLNRWQPANSLKALRTGLIDSVQVVYNVFDQSPEDELFPVCRELGIAVIARVPFDEGSLTGTLTRQSTWPAGDWRNIYFTPEKLRDTLDRVDRLRAELPDGMTLAELALRFILESRDVSTVIPGMRTTGHVRANVEASGREPLDSGLKTRLGAHRWDRVYVVP